jgi:hypothetical protein
MSIRQGKQIIANTQGTRNYDLLDNKPKIDGVELSGEITLDDLNVQSKLSAGTGIEIVDGVINNTQTSAEWGKITGNIGVPYAEGILIFNMIKTILMPKYPDYFTGV